MSISKRVFILGAGFSKPAGMPLATELLTRLKDKLKNYDDMWSLLDHMQEQIQWLSGNGEGNQPFKLNVEKLFHYGHFDAEALRLKQQLSQGDSQDGPGTPRRKSESIELWLSTLEDKLRDVISEADEKAHLEPIQKFTSGLTENDCVITFNYDTLVERALTANSRNWNHGLPEDRSDGVSIYKAHGSID